jgi:hypothetical protein
LVERDLAKVEAAGSNPVSRSRKYRHKTLCRQRLCFLQTTLRMSIRRVAGMVELVDTQDLKSCERKLVRVRFPLLVLITMQKAL